jgi:hypothetical protein
MEFREALLAARILARLGTVDDQMLCAAILHDTVEDTPYTLPELRRDFDAGVAAIVAQQMALDHLRYSHYEVTRTIAAIGSADARVIALKLADRLHNMQTLQFLPQAKQLQKAREALDIFLPVAHQLRMHTVSSELQALACAALIRNRPAGLPRLRAIVALDIEQSTTRPDPVKAEFRIMLYELFEAALRSAGVGPDRRDPFVDRGDGLLALVDPAELAPLLSRVVPVFAQLLAGYNASLPPRRQLRVRVVVHAGQVRRDDNGYFGEALDIACRLLDAPEAKAALKAAPEPLLLIVSSHIATSSPATPQPAASTSATSSPPTSPAATTPALAPFPPRSKDPPGSEDPHRKGRRDVARVRL